METTLTKIRNLERIYISGYGDDFMDRALDKLLSQQRTEDESLVPRLAGRFSGIRTKIRDEI